MAPNNAFWEGKKVFLTGHTGFKGSWLAFWLQKLGANVTGYALSPTIQQSLFHQLGLHSSMTDYRGDITNLLQIKSALTEIKPQILIHMAAQSLVSESYRSPVHTYSTNVMGTVNVLEAARSIDSIRAILIVTSDKCYENTDIARPYKETDPLGGRDPYSSSKACTELVTQAFRESFYLNSLPIGIGIATARAGNVIGGGDWANDRLSPDAMRAFFKRVPLLVRFPDAIRPWQHVLEPLAGYLLLVERMWDDPHGFSSSWNFGPEQQDITTVSELCDLLVDKFGLGAVWNLDSPSETSFHEAKNLYLDVTKAKNHLGWRTKWELDTAVANTVEWYKLHNANGCLTKLTLRQIDEYSE